MLWRGSPARPPLRYREVLAASGSAAAASSRTRSTFAHDVDDDAEVLHAEGAQLLRTARVSTVAVGRLDGRSFSVAEGG